MTYQEFKANRDGFTVDEYANVKIVEELEKIKADLLNNPIYVIYEINGYEAEDIRQLVTDAIVRTKNEVIRRLDKELSELMNRENKE